MMQRIVFCLAILLLAGLVTLPAVTAQKNDKAETLLQAAQHKQLVEGDLKGAIQLYQQIIAQHGNNRAAAAKALVQMGKCYEKLGRAEARKAYDQVVRDYGEQREMVAEARTRLAALSPRAGINRLSGPVVRQVSPDLDVHSPQAVSPDGRYLAFTEWAVGDLVIRDLVTGQNRRLTKNPPDSKDFADILAWSPDSKWIAYGWEWVDKSTKVFGWDLRIIGVDGTGMRVIRQAGPELRNIEPYGWSPDGKDILVNISLKDRINQFAWVSVKDGSLRILKTVDNQRAELNLSLSPDGRYIAYEFDFRQSKNRSCAITGRLIA